MKSLSILVSILIAMLSLGGYTGLGEFWFARGSSSALSIARLPIWAAGLACLGMVLVVGSLILRPEWRASALLLLPFIAAVWILSGRVVGVHSDGRVIAGWFFHQTSTIDLRGPSEDPEIHVSKLHIMVKRKTRLEFRTEEASAVLFVGPALMRPVLAILQARGFHIVCHAH